MFNFWLRGTFEGLCANLASVIDFAVFAVKKRGLLRGGDIKLRKKWGFPVSTFTFLLGIWVANLPDTVSLVRTGYVKLS